MGLTPLAGLMMGTRCGDIDASAVTYIMDKLKLTPLEMSNYLNKESGVLGITGISSDMRDIENAAAEGNDRAQLALKMYNYRIKKYIGAYAAALGGVDAIVWTAGVGENQTGTREKELVLILNILALRSMLRRMLRFAVMRLSSQHLIVRLK